MTHTPEPTPQNIRVVEDMVGDQVDQYAGQAARLLADRNPQGLQQEVQQQLNQLQTAPRVPVANQPRLLTEDTFKPIAQYVLNEKIACRYGEGTDTKGAAYALTDISKKGQKKSLTGMDVLQWTRKPYNDVYDSWDDRLWNTCMVIVGLIEGQSKKVVLLGGTPGAISPERYSAKNSGVSRGDGDSFGKVNITDAATFKAEITISSTDSLVDKGETLYKDIYTELRKLANRQQLA